MEDRERSYVKVSANAKGEAQVEVKAVHGGGEAELPTLRAAAVREYCEAMAVLRPTSIPQPASNAA